MRDKNVRMLVEGALMVALSFGLHLFKIYQAPYGGSVTLGSMVPLILFAIRYGAGPGITVGAAYGLVDFIVNPYVVHPAQVILDYPLAYGLLGLSGLFRHNIYLGSAVGIFGRLISHFLSGVIFFAEYAEGNVYLYSLVYNAQYLVPELLITAVVLRFALKRLLEVKV
ncbi:MAG: energy-coupled thiamine transporter ThiT [Bacillota bacterium]|jgi:thiamine transporter